MITPKDSLRRMAFAANLAGAVLMTACGIRMPEAMHAAAPGTPGSVWIPAVNAPAATKTVPPATVTATVMPSPTPTDT